MSPKTSKTFEEYAVEDVFLNIQTHASKYERTENVFYVYWTSSLTTETRSSRDEADRCRVTSKTKLPPNWKSFLQDRDNKTELFESLADMKETLHAENVAVVTKGEQALSNKLISLERLCPCNHEESSHLLFMLPNNRYSR